MDYSLNKKYFENKNSGCGLFALVFGIIGIIVLFNGSYGNGFFMALLGFGIFYFILKSRVSDSAYDGSVLSQISNLKKIALEKLGVDEDEVKEVEPIIIGGYSFDSDSIMVKQGADGIWRSNQYEVCMIFFSANEVHCYRYNCCTTDKNNTEGTDVYFYNDLVSVSTISKQKEIDIDGNTQKINIEYFKLTTSGGTAFEIATSQRDNAKEKINGMRSLIKSKKLQN